VAGADATVIVGAGGNSSVVEIYASNVTFGSTNQGFTLIGAGIGLTVAGGNYVRVSGNIAVDDRRGFVLAAGASNIISGNRAIDSSEFGFSLVGTAGTLQANTAVNCGVGFFSNRRHFRTQRGYSLKPQRRG
jgi:parallel beta-helix repeat protein